MGWLSKTTILEIIKNNIYGLECCYADGHI